MSPEVFKAVKLESDFLEVYSYIRRSEVDPKYLEKHFFKAEFLNWEANEYNPYCKVIEDLGPMYDEANYRKIIMLN